MPAKEFYHPHVVDALVADGWTITHDPLSLRIGGKDMFVDLGAERFVGAERVHDVRVVEVLRGHREECTTEGADPSRRSGRTSVTAPRAVRCRSPA